EVRPPDIAQCAEDHPLRHPVEVVGGGRPPPLRHVDADKAAQVVVEYDPPVARRIEACLERPADHETEPGGTRYIRNAAEPVEPVDDGGARSPALVEAAAQLGKRSACRCILGLEPGERSRRDGTGDRARRTRTPVESI